MAKLGTKRAVARVATTLNTHDAILVWRYDDAPDVLRTLSEHGGDEEWVALVPPTYQGENDYGPLVQWAEEGTQFAPCALQRTKLHSGYGAHNGWEVWIGAHS